MARLVMLTKGTSRYPLEIIAGLERNDLKLDAIIRCSAEIVGTWSRLRRDMRKRGVLRAGLSLGKDILLGINGAATKTGGHGSHGDNWKLQTHPAQYFENVPFNSDELVNLIRSLETDVLILGGIGIVKQPTLSAPKIGTLNVHPGLLPFFRGVGVVGRAVLHNFPIGVTCHFVNAGIDTGPILTRRLVPAERSEITLAAVQQRAMETCAMEMVDVIQRIVSGQPPPPLEQSERFPMSKWLDAAENAEVEQRLVRGMAVKQFEVWRGRDLSTLQAPSTWPAVNRTSPQSQF